MPQYAKIIDITRTFLPVDPQNFPANLHATQREDAPEKGFPIVAYEGYNFLPTHYGYKSFFGTTGKFDIAEIPARVDKLLIFQTSTYANYIVALTEEGVFTHTGNTADSWVQVVTLAAPAVGTKRNWSFCVIGNTLYVYRAQEASYWTLDSDFAGTANTVTPTFLNMAGQRGIFKAGGRLGFWDSMNSIAWSNLDDHADFEPSITTLAGAAIFNEVKGKITNVLSHGDGFVIYSTKSIILVARDLSATFQWNPKVLMSENGVAYPTQAVAASPDTLHFAYTDIGLRRIEGNTIDTILTELTDLLQESLYPTMLDLLENRYLAFKLIESKFVEGLVQFESQSVDGDPYIFEPIPEADLSTYSDEDQAWIVAEGRTEEMQADFRAAVIAAGRDPDEVQGYGRPIWEGSYSKYKLPTLGDAQTRYTAFLSRSFHYGESVTVGTMTYNAEAHTWGDGEIPVSGVGSEGLFSFIISLKSEWDEEEASLAAFYTDTYLVHHAENTAFVEGFPWIGADSYRQSEPMMVAMAVKNFTYTKCSCVGRAFGGDYKALAATKVGGGLDPEVVSLSEITGSSDQPFIFREDEIAVIGWEYLTITEETVQIAAALCELTPESHQISSAIPAIDHSLDTADPANPYPWVTDPIDTPDVTITLQDGDPGPIYPTYAGALFYDLELKKWGKMKLNHTELLDLSPINTNQGKIVTTKRFGIDAAASLTTGFIHRFDQKPTDSYIKYGKIGYNRLGMTDAEEVRVQFRIPCTGTIEVESSLDGRNIEQGFESSTVYTEATHQVAYPNLSGRWHNITFRGNYDITHLEFVGRKTARR